ncbi:MAG: GGDEF and EAL domain-containing protein [Halothiobacillaceae bacterium]|nr:MAG: GGDEF and EAL domain-containing protein [Halothiobacillaceae bacterium]
MNPIFSVLKNHFGQLCQGHEQCPSLHERISLLEQERDFQRMQADYLASHDALTGLPNRNLFRQRAIECMELAHEENQPLALMFLDLDNFKMVNDTLGHVAGDALLVEASHRMRKVLGGEGFLARLGGDEFGLLLRGGSVGLFFELAHAMIDAIRDVYDLDGLRVSTIGASIGMALYPDDGENLTELLRHADAAMYESKRTGKNRVTRFHPDMHRRLVRRSQLAEQLREAIRTGEGLSLALQPKVRLKDQGLTGFEALARWRIPGQGAVSPMEFIPLAEFDILHNMHYAHIRRSSLQAVLTFSHEAEGRGGKPSRRFAGRRSGAHVVIGGLQASGTRRIDRPSSSGLAAHSAEVHDSPAMARVSPMKNKGMRARSQGGMPAAWSRCLRLE